MTTPFDYVNSVSQTKKYLIEDEASEKAYVPFLINRTLSFNVETLLHANMMNINNILDKKLQYDYFFYLFPAKKRYNKWAKKKISNDLELVREYYQCNVQRAKEALTLLTKEQLTIIRKKFEQGGINK